MNVLSLFDLKADQIHHVLKMAATIKAHPSGYLNVLKGKSIAMLFEKPSLRTRVTFEVGIQQMGGHAIYLDQKMIEPGGRESIQDIANNLSLWTDAIVARVFKHETLKELAGSKIPVINALCDIHHPCQTLADLLTIQERYPVDLRVVDILYLGEGNNVCQSFMVGAAALGLKLTVVTPEGYGPTPEIWQGIDEVYPNHNIRVINDLSEVQHADVVYTDTWVSMGSSMSDKEAVDVFGHLQVNQDLIERLQATTFLHCLPAHRGHEVTDEVLDGPISAVLQQAENRLYVQKALLHEVFNG
ncbi:MULTISPECIES: ornithine carbamoyltransferase [Gammaproteobacteria]|uniref:ornithine carbamoyltransferase n=1 Tax=Gammaproteobacteria TaxID=1236 RepID=UPI000DD09B77|nr:MULTISPECIES: ornithine carbamoyltransferase [Gammaproteobacteria]RTE87345.1 ornithine carbamoyltransferase [Aliidiomarina sp. B3213]TCZ92869.1 ornithine carbamoyltransferase [Lysobacter sp. N42]